MKFLYALLVFVPITIIGEMTGFSDPVLFACSSLAIVPLAGLMGKSTEAISVYCGQKIGGLLNATFGNATELIIAFVAMKEGMFDVVKASLAGSVIGNILLVLSMSMLVGGLKYKTQEFNRHSINITASMLLFAVLGLAIPAIFTHTMPEESLTAQYEGLSVIIAVLMLLIYAMQFVFSFVTHKSLYEESVSAEEESHPQTKLSVSVIVLIAATVCIAVLSEIFVGTIEPMAESAGLSTTFVGIILVPIIGNAAEHSSAIFMAYKNKMNAAVEIALGSSLQIILFVMPVLILLSLLFTPMSIIFTPFELVAVTASVLIANRVDADGESNWLEGLQLVSVYIMIGAAFFFV
ncbi:MAG: calcium/proton exchanger [Clostridiales bacterium]|nr:calcium/proton exchanger [Clostridiales bacterium]